MKRSLAHLELNFEFVVRCMGVLVFLCIRDSLITPELRTCRNYYSEESEAERTMEAERPIFFVLFWKGIGGPEGELTAH